MSNTVVLSSLAELPVRRHICRLLSGLIFPLWLTKSLFCCYFLALQFKRTPQGQLCDLFPKEHKFSNSEMQLLDFWHQQNQGTLPKSQRRKTTLPKQASLVTRLSSLGMSRQWRSLVRSFSRSTSGLVSVLCGLREGGLSEARQSEGCVKQLTPRDRGSANECTVCKHNLAIKAVLRGGSCGFADVYKSKLQPRILNSAYFRPAALSFRQ